MLARSPITTADLPQSCVTQLRGQGGGSDYGGVNLWPIEPKVVKLHRVKGRRLRPPRVHFNTDVVSKSKKKKIQSLIFVPHVAMIMIAAVVT